MVRGLLRLLSVLALVVAANAMAFAQTSSSISGTVTDTAGGTVPGASVTVTNNATKTALEGVTNSSGTFSFPALPVGTYTVKVTLAGFKTFIANEVRLLGSQPANVPVSLEIGALTEQVEVRSGTELVQTSANSVTSTLTTEQLSQLPLSSRNALYAVALLPGVSGGNNGPRNSGINGLPNNTVNITIDGVSTGNMLQSTDGFFSMVTPRMDAVEEITVTGAVPGAGAGAGSVQVAMTTRAGSNRFDGSAYHYWRQPEFNSNYYFNKVNNLPKNNVVVHQYGFRQGGPIVIPGLYDGHNKAFFFFNYERLYQPSSVTRTREFLTEQAASGVFGYNVTVAGVQQRREVNLLQLAAANGQISAIDPTISALLGKIRQSTTTTGTINDTGLANRRQFVFQSESMGNQYSPTGRVDLNLSNRHRLSGSYWWQRFLSDPDLLNTRDPIFPGLSNSASQNSYRTTGNSTLRSILGGNLVNEVKGGWQWSPNAFFANVTADQFADQAGYGITFPANVGNGVTQTTSPAPRNTTTWSVDDTLNWLRGSHSLSMGGGYAGVLNRQNGYTVVPTVTLGFDTNLDPARNIIAAANFPGATAAQVTEAQNIYALLTGRVLSIPGTARIDSATGKYVYNGDLARKSRQSSFNAFVQDSWKIKPTLTVNYGVRWDAYMPFTPVDNSWSKASLEDICGISGLGSGVGGRGCNLFKPGSSSGQLTPTFDQFKPGESAFKANWFDFAPNAGVAWRPDVQGGWLRALLGDPEQATIRAGYGMSYNQERIERFAVNSGSNSGGEISVTRNNTTGFPLVLAGESQPVLLSQKNRLGPPVYPDQPIYPISAASGDSVNIFPDKLKTPRVHSYSVGVQRSLGQDMALEVRYVGNRNLNTWAEENYNERMIFENGFLDEFKLAQRNVAINAAAGINSFAYTGLPGTSPLPIHLAYLTGRTDASNPAAYSASTNFTNGAFINRFSPLNPNVTGVPGANNSVTSGIAALDTAAFRANALAAGFARNFLVLNPQALGGTFVQSDQNWTKYNSLQMELRRRLSKGLLVSGSYTYGIKKVSSLQSLRIPRIEVDASDDRNSPHIFKGNWFYEIPVGRGRRFGGNMHPVLDTIVGNWEFSGNGKVQADRYRMVGVKLEGMTQKDLQKMFKISVEKNAAGVTQVFSFPADVRANTWAAFSVDPTTATGYSVARGVPTGRFIRPASDASCMVIYRGDCNAPDINLNGPLSSRWDMRVKKRFPIGGRVNIELMAEVLNAFDNINFNHSVNFNPNNGEDTFRVTSAYTDINTTFDPGGRVGQLVWRVNW